MNSLMTRLLISGILLLSPMAGADAIIQFNRDVRPILSDKCYSCHGPDAVAKRIPRRLDSEAAAKAEQAGKRAIVPGDLAASELIRRIASSETSVRMPPAYSNLKLSDREIETLRTWIAQGSAVGKALVLYLRSVPHCRPSGIRLGCATRSTFSSWRSWNARA